MAWIPEFTNEVQHLHRVLPWEPGTYSSRSKTAAALPAFKPRQLDPANRGSSGSRAIDHCSRAEAQRGRKVGYQPAYAHEQTRARRWKGSKLESDHRLRADRARPSRPRLVARAGRRPARPRTANASYQPRDHLPLHLRPDRPHQGLRLAALPAARQEQARTAAAEAAAAPHPSSKAEFPLLTAPRRGQRPANPGHWEADLMMFCKVRPGHPHPPRAHLPHPARRQARQQNRRPRRRADRAVARTLSPHSCADHHLRQRHRVRPPLQPAQPRAQDLLLRSLRPLAERRHRKRHRPNATPHPAQNRPRHRLRPKLRRARAAPTTTPRRKCLDFQNPRRGIPPTCCTSNVNPPPRLRGDDVWVELRREPSAQSSMRCGGRLRM